MVEAWALTQAALQMKAAQENADPEEMRAAVRLNWRLWTIIQADLLEPDCPVPNDIRSNVLSLANFIDKHTMQFFSAPLAEKMDVLININRELAAGLYSTPEEEKQQGGGEEPQGGGTDQGGGQTPPPSSSGGIIA